MEKDKHLSLTFATSESKGGGGDQCRALLLKLFVLGEDLYVCVYVTVAGRVIKFKSYGRNLQ